MAHMVIAVGVPKKKAGSPLMEPPPEPKPKGAAALAPAPKPKAPPAEAEPDAAEEESEPSQAIRPEDVDYSADDLCGSCKHMAASGTCSRYGFEVSPNGHCEAGYEPQEGAGEGEPGAEGAPEEEGEL